MFLYTCIFLALPKLFTALPLHLGPNPEETGPYFQSDIILPVTFYSRSANPDARWPMGQVFYKFDANYPDNLRYTFMQAISEISARTCVSFLPATPFTPDFVVVSTRYPTACFSSVGRQGGSQLLNLPPPCNLRGTFIHELLHVLGFHHEHSRTDRDSHIRILWENVQTGKEAQFRVLNESTVTSFGVPYDHASILHYSKYAFSKDTKSLETIQPIPSHLPEGLNMGQRRELSDRDVEKVNRMYACRQNL